jgi:hypothetical protein
MTHRLVVRSVFVLGMMLAPAALGAQSSVPPAALPQSAEAIISLPTEPRQELKNGKVLRALRLQGVAPVIDGALGDEAWTLANRATGFVQRDPDNGQPMTEDTYVQIAYDDRYLYVAVTCLDRSPDDIQSGLSRRDDLGRTDELELGFDPRHDHQTGYIFRTNPSAVQGDSSLFNDESQDQDYNAVWDVRTARSDRGWTAEFRIPFSQMRFSAGPEAGQVWGFNAAREVRRKGETGSWIPRPRGVRGDVSLFGHLVFDAPVVPPRRLELAPYVAARSENVPAHDIEAGASAGLDVRMGIGNGATLSGTFNPDFGQVEQDPAVLNLSVFETFFPEKRPFFLEDSRTFVPPYGLFQLFHSRRIGRSPGRLPLAAGEQVIERPDETTILGATKLTGKGSGWTYGLMTAMTSREYAQVESPITDADGTTTSVRGERLIEPATSYNVARVQRDVMNGTSNVGGIITGVLREQTDDAFTAGMDYTLRWDSNRVNWNGHWVATRAPGPGGMKTSAGGVTNVSVSRKHVNLSAHYDHFGRDFRVNDLGFFRTRGNRNQVNGGLELGNPDPWKKLRSVWGFSYWNNDWTDEKLVIGRYQESGVNIRFMNFWQVVGGGWRNFGNYDDLDTRGGPPIQRPGSVGAFYRVNSDSRKQWSFNFYGNRWRSDVGRTGGNWSPGFSFQPSDRLQTSMSLNYNYGVDDAQWITNVDTTGDGAVDHVYGTLTRDVVDITLRGTYAFTRDLTLQAYLQPFVAAGDYDDIRILARPRSYEFAPAAIDFNPDFNRKSLRGNIVMRWEYKPGSTLFFVWDLSQSDLSRPGEFRPLRDLRTAFGADATHIVMVKASYWLNR